MFGNSNPKLSGKFSKRLSQIFTLAAGNDITISDLGSGTWQIAYAPKAPQLLSVNQDYNDYQTTSPNQIAAYSHGKTTTNDQDSYIYTLLGYSDTVGQTIDVDLDFQNCGSFVTTAVGGFQIRIEVLVRNVSLDDCDVYTYFQGAGLSACQPFTNLRGNQLVLAYGGNKFIDPYFTAGAGNVELSGFNAIYKPAGST